MSRTVELKKQLKIILKTITTNVHYEIASDKTSYPYLVYEINELIYEDGKAIIELEVSILDYDTSTNTVETLADNLQNYLHKLYFINNEIQFSIYRLNRNTVQEEDKKIRRRRLTFEIHLHEIKEE